ncbi:hypothetical protein WI42_13345 [Burkholderia ubonensis]|nr:hypothetical protein WI42_13345 [Burkholderia ubonensis]KVA36421.1 hypothetical protein WI46_19920 [Burkholderia ubonensis]
MSSGSGCAIGVTGRLAHFVFRSRSPISEFAEIVLRIQGRPFAMLQTNVPALALAEALVIGVTNRHPELARQRMEKIEYLNTVGIGQDTNQRDLPE